MRQQSKYGIVGQQSKYDTSKTNTTIKRDKNQPFFAHARCASPEWRGPEKNTCFLSLSLHPIASSFEKRLFLEGFFGI